MKELPPSAGAANTLWRVSLPDCDAILKVRADPGWDVKREAWALRQAGARSTPELLATVRIQDLMERAIRRRDLDTACALDGGLGDLLLLRWCPGHLTSSAISDAGMASVGRAIADLHVRRPRSGPRSLLPSSPRALSALARDLVQQVSDRELLPSTGLARVQRAATAARRHLETTVRATTWHRVRTLCHGDLRWHNMLLQGSRVWLLDLEHAGIGDPALDLALMACRTPLSSHDELRVLDAYLACTRAPGLLDRYFGLKPLVGVVAALAGVIDLADLRDGARCAAPDPRAHLQQRAPLVAAELGAALERALGRPTPALRLRVTASRRPVLTAPGPIAIDGTAASQCSPLARRLAEITHWAHVDTGALYRYAALLAWSLGLHSRRTAHCQLLVRRFLDSGVRASADGAILVHGQRLEAVLQSTAVEMRVAAWAALPELRAAVQSLLRPWLHTRRAIVEGRDVGAVLLPHAPLKVFVDGPRAERAARLAARTGYALTRAQALLAERDARDRARAVAPLREGPGSLCLRIRDGAVEAAATTVLDALLRLSC
ncbi:MAG: (d)CMP kinase [Pseudomonadota bacterium]